jgi:hypothetical protein
MAENIPSSPVRSIQFSAWRKRHRFSIQSLVLVIALLSPFALYWALEAGQNALAAFFFGLLALALAVTAWIG